MEYTTHNPLRVFEAFAGYGSQHMALTRLRDEFPPFDFRVVGISEIDPHAIRAYMAVHGDTPNYGDIANIDWAQVPDFDLLTYSFPCTSVSTAGLQRGLDEGSGTASSLLWECRKAVDARRPKWLLMENVKALTHQKFMPQMEKWMRELHALGYKSFWKVLNAKDYGVPQNRERVFMVSVLDQSARFEFPKPFPLETRLRDVLESDVDEYYFLRDDKVMAMIDGMSGEPSVMFRGRQYHAFESFDASASEDFARDGLKDVSRTLRAARCDGLAVVVPACLRMERTDEEKSRRHLHGDAGARYSAKAHQPREDECTNTITTIQTDNMVLTYDTRLRIRRLTPRECFRLMGVDERDIDKIQNAGISRTQQYKMAGNSIVVDCLQHIFRRMFVDTECEQPEQLELFK